MSFYFSDLGLIGNLSRDPLLDDLFEDAFLSDYYDNFYEPPSIEEIIAGIPDLVSDTAPPPAPDIDIPPPAPLPPATQEAAPAPETEESEEDPEPVFLPNIREKSRDILNDVLDRVGFTPPISPTGGTPPISSPPSYIPTSPRIPGTTVPSTPYIPPGPQTTVPERIRIEGRIPIPGPGFEDLPIDLGSVQDILDVILDGAPPPRPQIPTLPVPGAPSTPVLGEVEDVLGGILDSIPILGDILGSPDEPAAEQPPAAEPLPPIPGEADEEDEPVPEPLPPIPSEPEPPSLDDILDPPSAPEDVDGALGITEPGTQEPSLSGEGEEATPASEEPVDLGTAEPAPEDLGSLMGLMGLMEQITLQTPKPGDIRIYDLENFFGVSGLDDIYNAPFSRGELALVTEELLKAARERR